MGRVARGLLMPTGSQLKRLADLSLERGPNPIARADRERREFRPPARLAHRGAICSKSQERLVG